MVGRKEGCVATTRVVEKETEGNFGITEVVVVRKNAPDSPDDETEEDGIAVS